MDLTHRRNQLNHRALNDPQLSNSSASECVTVRRVTVRRRVVERGERRGSSYCEDKQVLILGAIAPQVFRSCPSPSTPIMRITRTWGWLGRESRPQQCWYLCTEASTFCTSKQVRELEEASSRSRALWNLFICFKERSLTVELAKLFSRGVLWILYWMRDYPF